MAAPFQSQTLLQLSALCARHPSERKIVFVPHMQVGQTLETALARFGGSWAGLECTTPLHFAQSLSTWVLHRDGRHHLGPSDAPFFIASIVEDLPSDQLPAELPAPQHIARMVARSVATLRENGISANDLRRYTQSHETQRIMQLLHVCYERYESELEAAAMYDDASLISCAADLVEREKVSEVADTVFAICDPTALSNLSCRLITLLRYHGRAFYRIGHAPDGGEPPHTAAAFFADVPVVDAQGQPVQDMQISTWRATGVQGEVDGVFQKILDDGLPLDHVEIAYSAVKPYLSLLSRRAESLGIPLRFSAGQPADQTLTGQALRGFFEWIQEDFDVAVLIRLLRTGLIRLDDIQQDKAGNYRFSGPELASFLASRSYEPGRSGYDKAFRIARENAESSRERAATRDLDTSTDDHKLQQIAAAEAIVRKLLALAPRRCTLKAFAEKSVQFLQRFAPINPSAREEEKRGLEEAARQVIYQKLERLTHTPVDYEGATGRIAQMLAEALKRQFVRSEQPKESAASVVPLEIAGYSGRRHLFVIGMDGETLSWPSMDDAMLRDADRAALGEDLDIEMAASRGAADEAMWRVEQALRRHRGNLDLFASVYDIENSEPRFPAALFLELENDEHVASAQLGLLPGDERLSLDEDAAWLRAHAEVRELIETPYPQAGDIIEEKYPFVQQGEFARQQMASDEYTIYDGLLAPGDYPQLDVRDGPILSAGRLEMLAETPYAYFLKYVLGVAPLTEPALDDEAWMSMLRRGNILHRTFEKFMREVGKDPVMAGHEAQLMQILDQEIEAEKREVGPPSDRVEASARRLLRADARIFLRAEIARPQSMRPWMLEVGFGTSQRWRREDDYGPVRLNFGNDTTINMRGRIDRVDEVDDLGLSVLDYKTGSSKNYSESDPLKKGAHLQWALYAYALEELTGESVHTSGYFFTSVREMGRRVQAMPAAYRSEVSELLENLGRMARDGSFPMNPRANEASAWQWEGFDGVMHDLSERTARIKEKGYPSDRELPPFL